MPPCGIYLYIIYKLYIILPNSTVFQLAAGLTNGCRYNKNYEYNVLLIIAGSSVTNVTVHLCIVGVRYKRRFNSMQRWPRVVQALVA